MATRLVTPIVGAAGGVVTTAPFTGLANEDLIVCFYTRSATTVDLPTIANSAGLTFALLSTVQHNPVMRQRVWRVNVGATPPTNMTVTCTATGAPAASVLHVVGQTESSGDYTNIGTATSTVGDVTVTLPVAPEPESTVLAFFSQALGSDLVSVPTGYTQLATLSPAAGTRSWSGFDPAPATSSVSFDSAAVDTRRSVATIIESKSVPAGSESEGAISEDVGLTATFGAQLAARRSLATETVSLEMAFSASIAGSGSSPEDPFGTWQGATRTWALPSGIDPIAADNLTFSEGSDQLWWQLPIRSGRASASGTAFWFDRAAGEALEPLAAPNLAAEEADVALIDAMSGSSKGATVGGVSRPNVATWNALIGGAVGQPLGTGNNTQFDWRTTTDFGFGHCVNHLPTGPAFPQGSGWLFWVMQTVPASLSTDSTNAATQRAAWEQIIAGDHDDKYIAFGQRLALKISQFDHPRERYVLDANHEMNQSNSHRVFASTRALYKAAMERTIELIRTGAGFHVRFCHRPGFAPDPGLASIGAYDSYIPDNVDVLSLSFHPGADVNSLATVNALIAGTLDPAYYGLPDLLDAAAVRGMPIAFSEFSPKFQAVGLGLCPVANIFMSEFFEQVIVPNRSILVCDCVWNQNIRDLGAYEGTGSGLTQWNAMVAERKNLWVGTQSS